MTNSGPRVWRRAEWLGLALVATLAVPAIGQNVDGAIFTSTGDGVVVNENTRYGSKAEVYLNGGPQNHSANGLPDGTYYFQVTDPSGAVLLSTDDIACRQVTVSGGRVAGATGPCPHETGIYNPSNGVTPVQLIPYLDTPNPGGEYKVWITPVDKYDSANAICQSNTSFGFCNAHSKTDNFKVRELAARFADVTVCKFNDVNADGIQDQDESLIPHWPITATGVDGGTVSAQTNDEGCVTFTYSGFTESNQTQTVTLSEGTFGPDWTQTAPVDQTGGVFTVSGGVITVTLAAGDDLHAPNFGNTNPYCARNCDVNTLVVTKTAYPSLTRTFSWGIDKSVDETRIHRVAGGTATFNYTVAVTHDQGTDSDWTVTGIIRVSNPGSAVIAGIDVSDSVDNGGLCTVAGGTGVTIPGGSHLDLPYTCTYTSRPAAGIATATAAANGLGSFSGTASIDFDTATVATTDGSATVTDTIGGPLGTVQAADPSPVTFTYAAEFIAPSGTCHIVDNIATFTTNSTGTTGSDTQSATLCGGANVEVSKTAAGTFNSAILKSVDKTLVEQAGGSATFNYVVEVLTSGWNVTGIITLNNPNDWQDITVTVGDNVDNGGACAIDGGAGVLVPRSSSVSVPYRCTYASAPSAASGVNTVTAAWDSAASFTPDATALGTAAFGFSPLTITDTFNGTTTTLGTVAGNAASTVFTYAQTVPNTSGGACRAYNNTATITEIAQSSSQAVNICNTATGALTMGFWQNKNGQGIIARGGTTAGVCHSGAWLRQYAPFQDLSATATCSNVAAYATTLIKAASARGAAMNAMLKAQMLATALDVYFSDPALGGNQIGATTPVGGVRIDLTSVNKPIGSATFENTSAAFGGASSLTVLELLAFAANQSSAGGASWYGQVKAVQELAKDTFDAINNAVAWIAR